MSSSSSPFSFFPRMFSPLVCPAPAVMLEEPPSPLVHDHPCRSMEAKGSTARLATTGGGVELGWSCWPRPVQLLWSLGGTARGNCRWCGARAAVRGDGELMVAGGVRSSGAQLLAAASTATSLGARAVGRHGSRKPPVVFEL
jgi:hypothetical protein